MLNAMAEFMKPQTKNRNRCAEIIDRLQNHTAPDLFVTPAIFDGRSALYVAGRPLNIPDTSRTVGQRFQNSFIPFTHLSLFSSTLGCRIQATKNTLFDCPWMTPMAWMLGLCGEL